MVEMTLITIYHDSHRHVLSLGLPGQSLSGLGWTEGTATLGQYSCPGWALGKAGFVPHQCQDDHCTSTEEEQASSCKGPRDQNSTSTDPTSFNPGLPCLPCSFLHYWPKLPQLAS